MNDFVEPKKVLSLLGALECDWGVAGGWAVDLFLNRMTRIHQDIEVAIFRKDQLALQSYLASRDWSLRYVAGGKLFPWPDGNFLELPVHEIWAHSQNGSVRLEVLLNEREANEFVFRRDFRVRAPIQRTFLLTRSGIRILSPEIVLLYKAARATEPKEQMDFLNVLPVLERERRQWLLDSVATMDPGHVWLPALSCVE